MYNVRHITISMSHYTNMLSHICELDWSTVNGDKVGTGSMLDKELSLLVV